ncbi:MAG: TonB-dependent receptor plug domain-containing protein, partial [Ilyomonas sp.]
MSDINPDDIQSVNILRGGAATALYGLRGANGV